ncbi:hypothetical protein CPB85DRAFT_1338534 [Mucidula mucida]|nr:hypothetical protein CPB85DRAFT_1338534 [Mucidula mucida]
MSSNVTQSIPDDSLFPPPVVILCYAGYTVVYFLSMHQICMWIFSGSSKAQARRKALAGTITILWAVLTMRVGCVWHFINAVYLEHGETRETEFIWMFGPRGPEPVETFVSVTLFALIFVADLIMIWRSWAIYARNWIAVILPVLTVITGLIAVSIQLTLDYLPPPSDEQIATNRIPALFKINWNTIYFAMIVSTNTLCTLLILGRILFLIGWRQAVKTYRGIVAIMVESALLYSGAFIIHIAMILSEPGDGSNVSALYVDAMLPSITCLAPTLVIVLVLAGRSTPTVTPASPPNSIPLKPLSGGTLESRVQFATVASASTVNTDAGRDADCSYEVRIGNLLQEVKSKKTPSV